MARRRKWTARTADKHRLYEQSVQSPEEDVRFFSRRYKSLTGKPLRQIPRRLLRHSQAELRVRQAAQ